MALPKVKEITSLESDLRKLAFLARIRRLDGPTIAIGIVMPPTPGVPGQFFPRFQAKLRKNNPTPPEVVAETATDRYLVRGWKRCEGNASSLGTLPCRYEFVNGIEF